VVATANDISNLPPELLRKGRLDEIFYVDLPSAEEREEIFRIHIGRRGRDAQNFDVTSLASASENFSGAEIEEAINSGLYEAFYSKTDLTTDHILHALSETVPLSRTMAEQIECQRAWVAGRARDASRPRSTSP
jgi:SpoVK/Ycf46/Vps4 family AAA+-type ATPase